MIIPLLTIVGLQGSEIVPLPDTTPPKLKAALNHVVDKFFHPDTELKRAIHYFKPDEDKQKVLQQVKSVVVAVGRGIDSFVVGSHKFINMISSDDLSSIDAFDLSTHQWVKKGFAGHDQKITVFSVFKGEEADINKIEELIKSNVPFLINISSSKDNYEILQLLGEKVAVFGDIRTTDEVSSVPKDQVAVPTGDEEKQQDSDQQEDSVIKPSAQKDTNPSSPQVKSSRGYWIIGGLSVAAFLAAFLYHKYGHMLNLITR